MEHVDNGQPTSEQELRVMRRPLQCWVSSQPASSWHAVQPIDWQDYGTNCLSCCPPSMCFTPAEGMPPLTTASV